MNGAFKIANLSQRPVRGFVSKGGLFIVPIKDSISFMKNPMSYPKFKNNEVNFTYFGKDDPPLHAFYNPYIANEKFYQAVMDSKIMVCLLIEAIYQNSQNGKWKVYKFCLKFKRSALDQPDQPFSGGAYKILFNNNEYTKSPFL